MKETKRTIRIAVTGPESTGKTTLALQLADQFHGTYLPEYARDYVEKLSRHYSFGDVEHIARMQVTQYHETNHAGPGYFFFDTWLIITKVWFMWVYQKVPDWLEDEIKNCRMDLYMLCQPDLPWEADAVRENGGEKRFRLYEEYKNQLIQYGFTFIEIGGTGHERFRNALEALENFLEDDKLSSVSV